jgi:hypothetical protein
MVHATHIRHTSETDARNNRMLQDCLAETTSSIFPHTDGKTKSEESRTASNWWIELTSSDGLCTRLSYGVSLSPRYLHPHA